VIKRRQQLKRRKAGTIMERIGV